MAVILLIESNPVMRPALQALLEDAGETVITAMDVPGALSMLSQLDNIDLIVADILIPKMDGVALVKRLRMNPQHQHLPLLIFSVQKNGKVRHKVLKAGATDFLSAPFTVQELQDSVKQLLAAPVAL